MESWLVHRVCLSFLLILWHLEVKFQKGLAPRDWVTDWKVTRPKASEGETPQENSVSHSLKLLYFELSPPWHLYGYILLLANLLAFYLTYLLAFYLPYLLAFYLAYLLAFYLAYLLQNVLAYLLALYLAYLLTFYLANLLAYVLANILALYLA